MSGKLEDVSRVRHCMANPRSYASSLSTYPPASTARVAAYALGQLEERRRLDVEAHEKNLPIMEANKTIRERIQALMTELEVPPTYRAKDPKSRARNPKMLTHDAGYRQDMARLFPVNDGFDFSTMTYNDLKQKYDAFAEQAEAEAGKIAEAKAAEAEAKKAARRKDLKLAEIILRYALNPDVEWGDALEALRRRDQRADLAVAMRQTRGDWSEGYYRVADALGRFTVGSVEDAEIQTDILSCFNDDIDGRVFRDTAWNYDRLFASLDDPQLAADIDACLENQSD